jgi:hypothetical protein
LLDSSWDDLSAEPLKQQCHALACRDLNHPDWVTDGLTHHEHVNDGSAMAHQCDAGEGYEACTLPIASPAHSSLSDHHTTCSALGLCEDDVPKKSVKEVEHASVAVRVGDENPSRIDD